MIPLSLITGFLGSGKTTLLQHIVDLNRERRLAYVVNECGAVDVDGRLLAVDDDRLVRIPGGSIFCRCRSGEFIRHLQRICEHSGNPPEPLDGVVVEASGMADPKVITQMLEETGLDQTYRLRTIVSVVDPGSFRKLIHTLPAIAAQVEACDLAVVNKSDLYAESEIRRVEEEVGRINPAATIVRSQYCRVEIDILAMSAARRLEGQYALCADPNYATSTVTLETPIDADYLLAELRSVQEDVYRAKGFVPVVGGLLHVDLSPGGLNARPVSGFGSPGHLVFVARPEARKRIDGLIARLVAAS